MRIVAIFANRLFAFVYKGEQENEYDRLLNLWSDAEYIRQFLKDNKNDVPPGKTINQLALQIIDDSYTIDDTLIMISKNPHRQLDIFFKPLHNQEYQTRVLSLQKGREHYLRLYAIRIDADCFVITGGAIKLTHLMQDRKHTADELTKLELAKSYLKAQNVFDEDSFFELITEQ